MIDHLLRHQLKHNHYSKAQGQHGTASRTGEILSPWSPSLRAPTIPLINNRISLSQSWTKWASEQELGENWGRRQWPGRSMGLRALTGKVGALFTGWGISEVCKCHNNNGWLMMGTEGRKEGLNCLMNSRISRGKRIELLGNGREKETLQRKD